MKGIVFCLYDESAASTRIRLTQYIKSLRRKGVQLDINFLLPQQYLKWKYLDYSFPLEKLIVSFFKRFCILLNIRKYDFAILYCELFPFFPHGLKKNFCLYHIYMMLTMHFTKNTKSLTLNIFQIKHC